jgi:uncharacterized HAD superfamily protein/hypoxanthine phosphoribosyltransferase
MHFRTFADMAKAVSSNLHKVPADVDLIVGIPRSGLLAAGLLALELNLPLTHLDGFIEGKVFQTGFTRGQRPWKGDARRCRHALLVDDSAASGATLRAAKAKIAAAVVAARVSTAVVFAAPRSQGLADIHFEVCPMPRCFAWNYMNHPLLGNCCVDIDGVLCPDPSEDENDDGPAYLRFLQETRALRTPSHEIGWLVTARIEKYRPQTEAWLRAHGIRYRELVMLDGCTALERRHSGIHGRFKAEVYARLNAGLFIESNPAQAAEIARLSGKPVICSTSQSMGSPDMLSLPRLQQFFIRSVQRAWRIPNRLQHIFARLKGTRP